MGKLQEPMAGSVFYEDARVYARLATDRIVEGHSVLAWKKQHFEDLSYLSAEDYQYMMSKLRMVRSALAKFYKAPKVYLAYLDELGDVHWHLFLRKQDDYVKGFLLMVQPSEKLADISMVPTLRSICKDMEIEQHMHTSDSI